MSFKYTFNVNPIAKGRPRFTKEGRAFTPAKTRNAEAELRYLMHKAHVADAKQLPILGPVILNAKVFFARPKSVSEKKRPHHTTKPDLTNVLKAIEDAGNGILWRDDSQIVNMSLGKVYSDMPRIEIEFWELI